MDFQNYISNIQVFPTGHIAPGTLVANTDTKHYLNLTSNIYRSVSVDNILQSNSEQELHSRD